MNKKMPMYGMLLAAFVLLAQAPLTAVATPAGYTDSPTTIDRWEKQDPCDPASCADMPPVTTINVGQIANQVKICVYVWIDIDVYVSAYLSPPGTWVRVHRHIHIQTVVCVEANAKLYLRDAVLQGDSDLVQSLSSATFSGLATGTGVAGADQTVLRFLATDRAGNELGRFLVSN